MKQIFLLLIITTLIGAGCKDNKTVQNKIIEPPTKSCSIEKIENCPKHFTKINKNDAISHPYFGKIIKNEIIVYFPEQLSVDLSKSVISKYPFKVLSYDPDTNIYQLKLLEAYNPDSFKNMIDLLQQEDMTEVVIPNSLRDENSILEHPLLGKIIKDEVVIYFKNEITPNDAITNISKMPIALRDYNRSYHSYNVRLLTEDAFEQIENILKDMRQSDIIRAITTINTSRGKIVKNSLFGKIVENELLIDFDDKISHAQIVSIIHNLPAIIISYSPETNGYQVRLTNADAAERVEKIKDALNKNKNVLSATLHHVLDTTYEAN